MSELIANMKLRALSCTPSVTQNSTSTACWLRKRKATDRASCFALRTLGSVGLSLASPVSLLVTVKRPAL